MEWLVLESGVRQYFPLLGGCHYPIRSWGLRSQLLEQKPWGHELALFSLNVCPSPSTGTLATDGECRGRGRPMPALGSWHLQTKVQPVCDGSCLCRRPWCCPCSAQRLPQTQVLCHHTAGPSPSFPHMPCCGASLHRLGGSPWALDVYQAVSCVGVFDYFHALSLFWCAEQWLPTTHPGLAWDCVISESVTKSPWLWLPKSSAMLWLRWAGLEDSVSLVPGTCWGQLQETQKPLE